MWRSPVEERVYESVLLRRTFRDGKKVKHETLANLSKLPREAVDAIEATLKGQCRARRAGVHDHPVAAAWARGRGDGDGEHAGAARAAGVRRAGRGISRSR